MLDCSVTWMLAAERAQGAEMARSPVEVDDEHRRAEGRRTPQQPQPRIAAKIIEDQAALPLFAEFGDHLRAVGRLRTESAVN